MDLDSGLWVVLTPTRILVEMLLALWYAESFYFFVMSAFLMYLNFLLLDRHLATPLSHSIACE